MNISKPPDLLHLYLDFGKHTAPVTDVCEAQTSVNFYKPEIDVLKHQYDQVVGVFCAVTGLWFYVQIRYITGAYWLIL